VSDRNLQIGGALTARTIESMPSDRSVASAGLLFSR
jgi:hypothetical protein